MTRILAAALLLCLATPALADTPTQADAVVLSVVDGDTVNVRITVWIDQWAEAPLRIRGIDTPELHGKCEKEITAAIEAKKALAAMVNGKHVTLMNIDSDKYGRVLARVVRDDGLDVGAKMIEAGLARPYNGEKRKGWC